MLCLKRSSDSLHSIVVFVCRDFDLWSNEDEREDEVSVSSPLMTGISYLRSQ